MYWSAFLQFRTHITRGRFLIHWIVSFLVLSCVQFVASAFVANLDLWMFSSVPCPRCLKEATWLEVVTLVGSKWDERSSIVLRAIQISRQDDRGIRSALYDCLRTFDVIARNQVFHPHLRYMKAEAVETSSMKNSIRSTTCAHACCAQSQMGDIQNIWKCDKFCRFSR